MALTIREAAKKREDLRGADAQALEHALSQAELDLECSKNQVGFRDNLLRRCMHHLMGFKKCPDCGGDGAGNHWVTPVMQTCPTGQLVNALRVRLGESPDYEPSKVSGELVKACKDLLATQGLGMYARDSYTIGEWKAAISAAEAAVCKIEGRVLDG